MDITVFGLSMSSRTALRLAILLIATSLVLLAVPFRSSLRVSTQYTLPQATSTTDFRYLLDTAHITVQPRTLDAISLTDYATAEWIPFAVYASGENYQMVSIAGTKYYIEAPNLFTIDQSSLRLLLATGAISTTAVPEEDGQPQSPTPTPNQLTSDTNRDGTLEALNAQATQSSIEATITSYALQIVGTQQALDERAIQLEQTRQALTASERSFVGMDSSIVSPIMTLTPDANQVIAPPMADTATMGFVQSDAEAINVAGLVVNFFGVIVGALGVIVGLTAILFELRRGRQPTNPSSLIHPTSELAIRAELPSRLTSTTDEDDGKTAYETTVPQSASTTTKPSSSDESVSPKSSEGNHTGHVVYRILEDRRRKNSFFKAAEH